MEVARALTANKLKLNKEFLIIVGRHYEHMVNIDSLQLDIRQFFCKTFDFILLSFVFELLFEQLFEKKNMSWVHCISSTNETKPYTLM